MAEELETKTEEVCGKTTNTQKENPVVNDGGYKTNKEFEEYFIERYGDEASVILFEEPSFIGALVGVTEDADGDNSRAIYDFDLMIEWLSAEWGMTPEDAIDHISYDTMRALPYMGPNRPIILNRLA